MVFETICDFLVQQLNCDPSRITEKTVFFEDLEMAAEDLVELMLLMESEFSVDWTEADLDELKTVGELTTFVEKQI